MWYYVIICDIVANFIDGNDFTSEEWGGPNINDDTEDELELAIRLCPKVFRSLVERDYTPFAKLTSSEERVSFIPFLLDMHPWFGKGIDNDENIRALSGLLLNFDGELQDSGWQPATPERDENP